MLAEVCERYDYAVEKQETPFYLYGYTQGGTVDITLIA